MKKILIPIIMILMLTTLISCSDKVVQVKEKDQIKELKIFFEKIETRRNKVKTIFIEAKADIFQKGSRVRGRLMMSVKRPGMARVDTIAPYELPISTLIIKDNQLSFYNIKYNKLYQGPATENNISRFLPVRLNMEQFIDMLTGITPIIKFNNYTITYNKKDATYDIILVSNTEKQEIKYIASTLQIKKLTLYRNNRKRFYVEFSDFRKKNRMEYARKIFFKDYGKKSEAKLKITEIEFNKPQSEDSYKAMKGNFRHIKLK